MTRSLLLLPLILLGCPETPWCHRLNPEQPRALRSCIYATEVYPDTERPFSTDDGLPIDFEVSPPDDRPAQAERQDGTRAAGYAWGVAWYAPDGRLLRRDSVGDVTAIGVATQSDVYALGMADGRVLAYDAGHQRLAARVTENSNRPDAVHLLTVSDDGTVVVGADRQRAIAAWDVASGAPRWSTSLAADATSLALAADGRYAAAGLADGGAYVWDAEGALVAQWHHPWPVVQVAFTDGGDHLVARFRKPTRRAYNEDVIAVWRVSSPEAE